MEKVILMKGRDKTELLFRFWFVNVDRPVQCGFVLNILAMALGAS